jgi:hypothetical protein
LQLNDAGLICRHVDYWHCSKFAVVQQHFRRPPDRATHD